MNFRAGFLPGMIFALTLMGTTRATASTIFSTIGPGDSYQTTIRYALDGNSLYQAFHFRPSTLDSIPVALAK